MLGGFNSTQGWALPCPTKRIEPFPLAAGATWSCELALDPGATLHGHIEQKGVDIAVTLLTPADDIALEVDDPTGRMGLEIFHFQTQTGGDHQLLISAPAQGPSGEFQLDLDVKQRPRDRDKKKASEYRIFREADRNRQSQDFNTRYQAEATLGQKIDLWLDLGEPLLAARIQRRLGDLASNRGEFEAAISHFEKALPLYREHDRGWERAALYLSFATALRYTADPVRARQFLKEALEDSRRVGNQRGVGASFNELGTLDSFLGQAEEALDQYHEALKAWDVMDSAADSAFTLHNLGLLYTDLGDLDAARSHLTRSETLQRRIESRELDLTLTALGWLDFLDGDYDQARARYVEALAMQPLSSFDRVSTLELLGRLEAEEERFIEARRLFEEALDRVEGRGNPLDEALLSLRLAHLGIRRGDTRPQALAESRLLLETALKMFGQLQSTEGLLATYWIYAQLEIQSKSFKTAIPYLENALKLVESSRGALFAGSSRSLFFARHRNLHDALVKTLLDLDDPAWVSRALEVSEKARGRGLLDEVAGIDWRQRLTPALRQKEQELRDQLNARSWQIQDFLLRREFAAADFESEKIKRLEQDYRDLERKIRKSIGFDPAADPLDARGIQSLLDQNTVFLSFHGANEGVVLFWIDLGAVKAYHLTSDRRETTRLSSLVDHLLETVEQGEETSDSPDLDLARSLSQSLLGPVASRLKSQRLVIIADGPLLSLPFSVLPTPNQKEAPGGQTSTSEPVYLIDQHEIVHLPSASLLDALRRRETCSTDLDLALFTDAVYQAGDSRFEAAIRMTSQTASDTSSSRRLPSGGVRQPALFDLLERLPATSKEAQSILAQVAPTSPVFVASGFDTNREAAIEQMPRARRIHFATHGNFDLHQPEISGLVLSLFNNEGEKVDGLLRHRDLASQKICAEQVVLSACQSGLGAELRGEGLLGLTHAFFLAGARSVVAAHWDIDDHATAELMARYYRALLQDQLPAPAALRQAQLSLRRETRWKAPAFWAGFSVQGDWR